MAKARTTGASCIGAGGSLSLQNAYSVKSLDPAMVSYELMSAGLDNFGRYRMISAHRHCYAGTQCPVVPTVRILVGEIYYFRTVSYLAFAGESDVVHIALCSFILAGDNRWLNSYYKASIWDGAFRFSIRAGIARCLGVWRLATIFLLAKLKRCVTRGAISGSPTFQVGSLRLSLPATM